ncbi:HPP family protein [Photobacterium galatheae]|uniref:HPP family protein n=1 Tax=Photobacterium galatheae TaxID=1654360 RepID=A0A066S0T0_9GAMM|nr:HPP family protein [Photobacterium galatheae]KDM93567.1 HPP family protein [Photobacterium galatheae]MCM0151390.1 HPP family protein [Photobacterium galatheae]
MNQYGFALISGLGAAVAIGLLSLADSMTTSGLWLMAPFGATAVLVFGVPDSPLAQPKNVIFGHLLTALIGVLFVNFVGVTPLTLAVASGLAVSVMLVTKTTHPPAGANPLLIMLTGQSWSFLITPVLLGAVVMVLIGQLLKMQRSRALSQ